MRRQTKRHSRTPRFYWAMITIFTMILVPPLAHLVRPTLADDSSGSPATPESNSSSDQQDAASELALADDAEEALLKELATHIRQTLTAKARVQASAPKEIESTIRQYFASMTKRDAAGVRAVLGSQLAGIEPNMAGGRPNARVGEIDTADTKQLLPSNDDWDHITISDVKVQTSTTDPFVATASFTLTRPLESKDALTYYEALLKSDSIELSDAHKKHLAKLVDEGTISNSMFAMLARQDGTWKIVCMSFP